MADSEAVANFIAFTGADEAAAVSMLEATGGQLEAAVNLYFAAGPPGAAPICGDDDLPPLEDDEAMARRLQQEAAGPLPTAGADADILEDEVRAPLPVYKNERLVGDEYRPMAPRRAANPVPQNVVDAFRNFGGEGSSRDGAVGGGNSGLAAMFEPPRDLLFHGSFEAAKQAAQEQQRWLLVNLQSSSQFASHQLNRDVWRNDTVRSLVQASFILYQVYDVVEEGQKLQHFYNLYDIPAILVVDPVTGAPMQHWNGFVDSERLTEGLLPFLEHDIHDPAAARLARRARSRKDMGAGQSSQPLTEEEELQRALQMSMAEGPGGGAAAGSSRGGNGMGSGFASGMASSGFGTEAEEEGVEEAPPAGSADVAPPARSAAEVQAEAAARVPEEPADGSGCRIAFRLPDGRRMQRRFPVGASLAAVYDFCLSQSGEAAGGRKFNLSQGFPGAPALEDQQQAVGAAGLNGAMLVLKWQD